MAADAGHEHRQGADGQAFIGPGFLAGVYALGAEMSEFFPAEGPSKAVVGIGQNWSEQRGAGVMATLETFKAANPDLEVGIVRLENPRDAMDLGIEIIYQYDSIVPTTTIARSFIF